MGHESAWQDDAVWPGLTCCYWLEALDHQGGRAPYGPAAAVSLNHDI